MESQKDKKKLYLMAGAPGSGKSHWINTHLNSFTGTTKKVSRDTIRFSVLEEGDEYFSKEHIVYTTFVDEIKDGLLHYDNTIADATHLNPASRRKLLRSLGEDLKDVEVNIIIIDTPVAVCLNQNDQREGLSKVPHSVVRRMFYSFVMPTLDEGFDNIIIYSKVGDNVKYSIVKKE